MPFVTSQSTEIEKCVFAHKIQTFSLLPGSSETGETEVNVRKASIVIHFADSGAFKCFVSSGSPSHSPQLPLKNLHVRLMKTQDAV